MTECVTEAVVQRLRLISSPDLKSEHLNAVQPSAVHKDISTTSASNVHLGSALKQDLRSAEMHVQSAETHVQSAGTHVQSAETHVQSADMHVQSAGTHVQSAETHIQSSETHIQSTELDLQLIQINLKIKFRSDSNLNGKIFNIKYCEKVGL